LKRPLSGINVQNMVLQDFDYFKIVHDE
jgi:hypothetical protein